MIGDRQFYPSETTEVGNLAIEELHFFSLVRQTAAGNNSFKNKIKQKNYMWTNAEQIYQKVTTILPVKEKEGK